MSVLQKTWWVVRGVLVFVNNVYCIPTYVIWIILLQPLYYLAPHIFWAIEGLFFHWLLTMVAFWSHSARYRIVESGDDVDEIIPEETLVLVNHQSTSDVPLMMAAFASRPSLLPNLNWIMDAVFKYTNFGVVSWLHSDFFINAGKNKRDASIFELISYLKHVFVPLRRKWLVLFPEGGFLRKRKEASNRYSRKMGFPELEHVTLPRMGAVQAVVETIGPKIPLRTLPDTTRSSSKPIHGSGYLKWIVDMTVAYPNGQPLDLVAIVTGCAPPCNVHFHYRVYPIKDVPLDQQKFQEWLYDRYLQKETMLGKFYASGVWGEEGRLVEQDLLRILILHIFFILSSLFHLAIFHKLLLALFYN